MTSQGMGSRWRSLMTSQGMGSRKGACSSFLEQGRKTKRSGVGEGKEERGEPESRYREKEREPESRYREKERGEPGEQVEGNGGRGLSRTDSCRVAGAA